MQQASQQMSSWVSLQQANAQTAANETESKLQTLNTHSSSLKLVRLTYISSADAALSLVAVSLFSFTWTLLTLHLVRDLKSGFISVFAKTHLCSQV